MSKRKTTMRMQEVALHFPKTGDEFYSINRGGEVLNTYVRHKTPLELWRRNGLRQTEYEAGLRYGALWREVCQPRSPAHSDPTRIVVDGGGNPFGIFPEMVRDPEGSFTSAARAVGQAHGEETVAFLNRLCGWETWPQGDKRRFKRICRKGLEVLAQLWRRR